MKIVPKKKQYGVVFRVPNPDKSMAVLLCARKDKSWERSPLLIEDKAGSYGTLGPEQMVLVEVANGDGSVAVKDVVRLGVTPEDGATDVLDAIQKGIFFEIAEKALRQLLASVAEHEKQVTSKPLLSLLGQETYIMDNWLVEKFEAKNKEGNAVYDVDEIKRMLTEVTHQTALDRLADRGPVQPQTGEQVLARKLEIEATAKSIREKFVEFIAPMQKGDEYWFFRSSQASWLAMAGREGYTILREGKVVAAYLTRRS
jgi:hypothetical protein